MQRREFIRVIVGSATLWPLAASAQQKTGKLPTIGFLGAATPSAWSKFIAAFEQRLRELGWIEGRTVAIEVRWAEGSRERYAEIAAEFVRLQVAVIVTSGIAALAAKQVTSEIPIVFAVSNNPVEGGLVASLARPGGNVTGLSAEYADAGSKKLELLREVVPRLRRVAIMANVDYPVSVLEMNDVERVARRLGLEVVTAKIRRAQDIAPAFESLENQADALYICVDALTSSNLSSIYASALAAHIPTIYGARLELENGGLISFGPSVADLFRRAGDYVDKILRGVKPADLPVEQPTKFELIINLKTAKTLGLAIPQTLLATADETIE
jgi:putative tryptophan/tyrosine transport system substrate-binding protein